ncbi:hypothetical protein F4859DRAFT_491466 [Xylaria cf. heliscus]|nr:hypothetical protein F4859DRAFT_491466 [Xylaria cf. heliscus]
MAPVQNTFSVIPDLPSAINGNHYGGAGGSHTRATRPPMTTRQVKKAYQKANKGPKLSRAEQRRQELFEQDRIRKEFEKEKNQARARAARDKKREREERERAEKKKKGLPLVDVRPSQGTIARFVRAKLKSQKDGSPSPLREDGGRCQSVSPIVHDAGKPRQVNNTDEESARHPQKRSHAVPVDASHNLYNTSSIPENTEPPGKKRKVEGKEGKEGKEDQAFPTVDEVGLPPLEHHRTRSLSDDCVHETPSPDTKQGGLGVDDSFSTIDLAEEKFLDDLFREMDDVSSSTNVHAENLLGQQQGESPPTQTPLPKPPGDPVQSPKKPSRPPHCLERTAKLAGSLLHPKSVFSSKPVSTMTKTPRQNPISESAKQGLTPQSFAAPPTSGARNLQPTIPSSQSFRLPRIPMAPAPAPRKFKLPSQVATDLPSIPQFVKPPLPPPRTAVRGSYHSCTAGPNQVRINKLPPSTQLFLLSHLDEFLPSPSQEVREIFEEPQDKHAGNISKTELTATHASSRNFKPNPNMPGMPTTSCNTSVNSTPSINTRGPRHIEQIADQPKPSKVTIRTPIQPIPQHTLSAFDIPFFSTQDLLLSSQDVKDIEEEPLSSPKTQNTTLILAKGGVEPRHAPPRSPNPFFTSTCRELRYKYALERGRTAAWEGPSAWQKAREELDRLQVLEDKRLEVLLANPIGPGNGNTTTIAVGMELDAIGKGSFTAPSRRTPTHQVQARRTCSGQGSYSISEDAAHKQTRVFPNVQKSRPVSSGSSYEAMLELLAKAPKQKPDTHVTNRGTTRDRGEDRRRHGNSDQTKPSQGMMTIPASQETDYDCGEEWDDDDLLCDML